MTGNLFIISAPSGTGKTSLVSALLHDEENISLSISHTSRQPRSSEKNGREYHFISKENFIRMQTGGEFLESAEVYGNHYGTSQKWINETIASGRDALLEIDCQGAKQVRQFFPQAVGIFILPPSPEVLSTRLRSRGQDSLEVIKQRLSVVGEEVSHVSEFDYIVINSELDNALADIKSILRVQRLEVDRQLVKHQSLVLSLGNTDFKL